VAEDLPGNSEHNTAGVSGQGSFNLVFKALFLKQKTTCSQLRQVVGVCNKQKTQQEYLNALSDPFQRRVAQHISWV
jgi:hypothetical protein